MTARYSSMIIRQLDMNRRLGVGLDAILIPLVIADSGFTALSGPIPDGWSLEDGDIGQAQTLFVVENDWVDHTLLGQATHFSVNGAVYEVIGGFPKAVSPDGSAFMEWKWPVSPTGEQFDVTFLLGSDGDFLLSGGDFLLE